MNFKDKVVLITGVGPGLGRACAEAFAQHGAKLVICDINSETLLETQKTVEQYGVACLTIQCDVSSSTQVSEMFQRNNRDFCDLPNSLAEYWVKTYVYPQIDLNANDLSQESVDKLCAMQAFLDNDIEDDTDCLTLDDWKQIAAFVNFEAEDMPIDLLSQMMSILVEKRAL